ncbi:hypothetical protein [uncultured Salegentibacter sp.]|uniref:hypothetical protein n=1 Tax=uncultured Salegentibacter sp. TaxID=259320 RepID=UPI0030D7BA91|tara:strand:+ start:294 stop:587 length:294 start_codon:yes stop_codon:yes gene_type:complete
MSRDDELNIDFSSLILHHPEYVNMEKLEELRKLGKSPDPEDLKIAILNCLKTPFILHMLANAMEGEKGNTPILRLLTREVNYRTMHMMHEHKTGKAN